MLFGRGSNLFRGIGLRNMWGGLTWLAVGLICTVLAVFYVKGNVEAAAQREFDFTCNEIRLNIADRLAANAQLLQSGAALFEASDQVSREEWRTFTQRFQLEQQLPGTQGIGVALLIPNEQLSQHIQEIRSQGFPNYQVQPEGGREVYSSIIYLEPFSERNLRAFGYDMFSEPVRRTAMERARDENSVALSGKVILVQETDQDIQAGTLMYVPVYQRGMPIDTVEQRRVAILGWVYSPYRMTDLIRGTLRGWDVKQQDRHIFLQVYDGDVFSTDTLLYSSESAEDQALASSAQVTQIIPVDFAGRRWTLRFVQLGGLVSTANYVIVWFVLFGGITISLLLSGFVISLLNTSINARRMAEQLTTELRTSKNQYDRLVSNIPVGVYTMRSMPGGAFRFEYVSPKVAEIFAVSAESFLADPQVGFRPIHSEDIDGLIRLNQERFQHPQPFDWEGRLMFQGTVRWLRIQSAPELLENGDTLWHGIVVDITEHKQAEEQIQQLNAGLEQRVRDRTARLQASNQELETFAYTISHDLRSPLRAIDGFSAMLLADHSEKLDEQGIHYLDRIREASQRMGQLIEDLLNLSKITRSELVRQPVNLSQMAQEIAARLQSETPQHVVEFDIFPDLVVMGDANLLKIALQNLFDNAYKFSFQSERARIQFGMGIQSGERVYFMRDNGIGFDMDYAGKLFAPFQRLHGLNEFSGTGIGLVTVQRIITRHGGRIWPEAKLNEGATFYFTLEA
jgi:PAS domain S-box-containing protein